MDTDRTDVESKDKSWYLRELQSNECLCGAEKRSNHSFCYRCYRSLPDEMRTLLYARIGQGYEENFEEAVQWLEENVW